MSPRDQLMRVPERLQHPVGSADSQATHKKKATWGRVQVQRVFYKQKDGCRGRGCGGDGASRLRAVSRAGSASPGARLRPGMQDTGCDQDPNGAQGVPVHACSHPKHEAPPGPLQ